MKPDEPRPDTEDADTEDADTEETREAREAKQSGSGLDYRFEIRPADPKNAFDFEDVADK